jgi:hypothetical protein
MYTIIIYRYTDVVLANGYREFLSLQTSTSSKVPAQDISFEVNIYYIII